MIEAPKWGLKDQILDILVNFIENDVKYDVFIPLLVFIKIYLYDIIDGKQVTFLKLSDKLRL